MPSNAVFTADSYVEGVTTTWYVEVDIAANINSGGYITGKFNSAFDVSGCSLSAVAPGYSYQLRDMVPVSGFNGPALSPATESAGATFTYTALGGSDYRLAAFYNFAENPATAGARVKVAFHNIVNPPAGTYAASTFYVQESGVGGSAIPASDIVITPSAVPPGAPAITGITPGDRQLSVAFTAPADDGGSAVTTYEYSTDNGSTWRARQSGSTGSPLVITTLSADGSTPLTNGTTYTVKIRAVNAAGSGTASSGAPGTPVAVPGAPSAVAITPGDAQLSVAYTAPVDDGGAAITSYQYSTDGGATWRTRQDGGGTTSPLIITRLSSDGSTALSNGTTYQVQIRAVNSAGNGTATASSAGTPVIDPRGSVTVAITQVGTVTVAVAQQGTVTAAVAQQGTVEVTIG